MSLSERAWQDPQRPRFHVVPPAGWLNDPNGCSQWGGRYHLFYQHNPESAVHHRIRWGHASSADLVHWTDEPSALVPSPGPDEDGCWSGVLVDDGGVPTVVYSGHRDGVGQRPCLATGDAELRSWRKDPANPVISEPPVDLDLVAFRDHCVWREGDGWRQLVGAGIRGVGGTALLYASPDLRRWHYLGPLLVGDRSDTEVWTGSVWECVDLFRLGPDGSAYPDVLVVSVWDQEQTLHAVYHTGRYAGGRFLPQRRAYLDLGLRYFYAPQSFLDASGRRVMFGWLPEGRSASAQVEAGWSGVMSVPREVRLGDDGALWQRPAVEVDTLRRAEQGVAATVLRPGRSLTLDPVGGDQLDLAATLVLPPGAALQVLVRRSFGGGEQTVILVTPDEEVPDQVRLTLDRELSSADPDVERGRLSGPVPLLPGRRLELRVLVDHSALEVFANGRALTARVYPTRADATGTGLAALAGEVVVERLRRWEMTDVWTGPRSTKPG